MRPLQSLAFSLLATSFFLSVSLLSYLNLSLFPAYTAAQTSQLATLVHLSPVVSHTTRTTLLPYLDKLFILLLPNHTLPSLTEEDLTAFTLTSSSDEGEASDMLTELMHGNAHGGTDGLVEQLRRNGSSTRLIGGGAS
jgi:hypothetical protein